MNQIKMMTCLGENTVPIFVEMAAELSKRVGIEFIFDPKPESTPAAQKLVSGDVQMGWICGLLYVMLVDQETAPLELLGAPIFSGSSEPDYYSHLIVPAHSSAETFEDLQGQSLAINETTSWSGYHLLRSDLYSRGLDMSFFGQVIESGGHSKSMRMVADGKADSATIDHGVFDYVAEVEPELMSKIKIIGQVGPSPSPPFVIHQSVPQELRGRIQQEILALGADPAFQERVNAHHLKKIVDTDDDAYKPIRKGYKNSLMLSSL